MADMFYGGQRPSFQDDGKGVPYSAFFNSGPMAISREISFDTSSKDPVLMRSRVFIGNILKGPIVREDLIELFQPYGTLLALTFFKGYAFVQYSEASEADRACAALNGKRWRGSMIDVHLAIDGPKGKGKRGNDGDMSPQSAKRAQYKEIRQRERAQEQVGGYPGEAEEDLAAKQNETNRQTCLSDLTKSDDLADTGMADTLICGGCRFVTCDFEAFREHRISGCSGFKQPGEPEILKCASCPSRFTSSWSLITHLTDHHRMMLYQPENVPRDRMDAYEERVRERQQQKDAEEQSESAGKPFGNSSEYQTIGTLVGFQRPPEAQITDYSADLDIQNFDEPPASTGPSLPLPHEQQPPVSVPHPSECDFLVKHIGVIQGR